MDDMTYPDKPRKQGPDSVLVMGSIFTRLRAVFSDYASITLSTRMETVMPVNKKHRQKKHGQEEVNHLYVSVFVFEECGESSLVSLHHRVNVAREQLVSLS